MQTNVMYYKDNTNVLLPYSKAPLCGSWANQYINMFSNQSHDKYVNPALTNLPTCNPCTPELI